MHNHIAMVDFLPMRGLFYTRNYRMKACTYMSAAVDLKYENFIHKPSGVSSMNSLLTLGKLISHYYILSNNSKFLHPQ